MARGAYTRHYGTWGLHTSLCHVGITHVIMACGAYTRHYGTWGLHMSLWHVGPRVERGTLYIQTGHLKATKYQTFLFMSGFTVPSSLASLSVQPWLARRVAFLCLTVVKCLFAFFHAIPFVLM